jgi:hypothetical protein
MTAFVHFFTEDCHNLPCQSRTIAGLEKDLPQLTNPDFWLHSSGYIAKFEMSGRTPPAYYTDDILLFHVTSQIHSMYVCIVFRYVRQIQSIQLAEQKTIGSVKFIYKSNNITDYN